MRPAIRQVKNFVAGEAPHPKVQKRLARQLACFKRSEWGEHQRDRAVAGMHHFGGVLAKQPYLAGDTFSKAAITDFAEVAIPEACAHLLSWRQRIAGRPCFAG